VRVSLAAGNALFYAAINNSRLANVRAVKSTVNSS
jgi:hypothetical protein